MLNRPLLATVAIIAISTVPQLGNHSVISANASPQDDRALEAAMDRISQSLDYAEKKIEGIKATTSQNSMNSIARRIDRAESLLANVDSSSDGYAEHAARISDLRALLQNAQQSAAQKAVSRDQDREALNRLRDSGQTSADDKLIREAVTLAHNMKFMDHLHTHLDGEYSPRQEYSHFATHFPKTYAEVEKIRNVYGAMDPRDVRAFSGPSLAMFVQEGGPEFETALEKLSNFGEPASSLASQKLNAAIETVQLALDNGRPSEILDNEVIFGALHYLENTSAIYNSRPDADPQIVEVYAEIEHRAEHKLWVLMNEAMAEVVKNNKPVANQFRNTDRVAIEQMVRERWTSAYPNDEILQIRIPQSDWVRRRAPGWRDGYLIMFDYSLVTPYVIVKEPNDMASAWGMVAEKDHTLQDRISISFGRLRTETLDPRYTVLISALD